MCILMRALLYFAIAYRYSLCYGKDVHRFISSPDTFYMFRNTYGDTASHEGASTIPSSIFAVYELGFALATPAIIACALGGTVRLDASAIFAAFANYLLFLLRISQIK